MSELRTNKIYPRDGLPANQHAALQVNFPIGHTKCIRCRLRAHFKNSGLLTVSRGQPKRTPNLGKTKKT